MCFRRHTQQVDVYRTTIIITMLQIIKSFDCFWPITKQSPSQNSITFSDTHTHTFIHRSCILRLHYSSIQSTMVTNEKCNAGVPENWLHCRPARVRSGQYEWASVSQSCEAKGGCAGKPMLDKRHLQPSATGPAHPYVRTYARTLY